MSNLRTSLQNTPPFVKLRRRSTSGGTTTATMLNSKLIRVVLAVGTLIVLVVVVQVLVASSIPAPDGFGDSRHERMLLESTAKDNYICKGFRTTSMFPFNVFRVGRYLMGLVGINAHGCTVAFPTDETGYCELVHETTGEKLTVFHQSPPLKKPRDQQGAPWFRCAMAHSFHQYKDMARAFEPKQPIVRPQEVVVESAHRRGIVIQVYPSSLASTYALIQLLRKEYNCKLPIELWSHIGDMGLEFEDDHHPLMKRLLEDRHIEHRTIWDFRFMGFQSKVYVIAYSKFDEVLYLDNDNFPVKDPTYLFDSPEFMSNSAVFWKDYWSPARDEFFIRSNSVLWELLGIEQGSPFTKEREAESGQLLIDRQESEEALKMLLFFAGTFSYWFEPMGLAYGDKDLFRFAWYLTQTPYHFISKPPSLAGVKTDPQFEHLSTFCGDTMIQPDFHGEHLFFHRNTAKLGNEESLVPVWEFGQEFTGTEEESQYVIGDFFDDAKAKSCYFAHHDYRGFFTDKDYHGTAVSKLEDTILEYAREAFLLMRLAANRDGRVNYAL